MKTRILKKTFFYLCLTSTLAFSLTNALADTDCNGNGAPDSYEFRTVETEFSAEQLEPGDLIIPRPDSDDSYSTLEIEVGNLSVDLEAHRITARLAEEGQSSEPRITSLSEPFGLVNTVRSFSSPNCESPTSSVCIPGNPIFLTGSRDEVSWGRERVIIDLNNDGLQDIVNKVSILTYVPPARWSYTAKGYAIALQRPDQTFEVRYTSIGDGQTAIPDEYFLSIREVEDSDPCQELATQPLYVHWNGYLNQINVLEVVNRGTVEAEVDISIFARADESSPADSQAAALMTVKIPAGEQRDIILNDTQGFQEDNYGHVVLSSEQDIIAQNVFYRIEGGTSALLETKDYNFAFSLKAQPALKGRSVFGYNRNNPNRLTKHVENYLTVTNIHSEKVVYQYGYDKLELEPGNSGHFTPNSSTSSIDNYELLTLVGSQISFEIPYVASFARYAAAGSDYEFAIGLDGEIPDSEEKTVSVSRGANAQDWLELTNTSINTEDFRVRIIDSNGVLRFDETISIPGLDYQHIPASNYLTDAGPSGYAIISPQSKSAMFLARSMVYFDKGYLEGITSAYVSYPSKPQTSTTIVGSYNTFLGMSNWLRLVNPSQEAQTFLVKVRKANGEVAVRAYGLEALQSLDLGIITSAEPSGLFFEVSPNSYNTIEVTTENGEGFAEILRTKYKPFTGEIEFALALKLR